MIAIGPTDFAIRPRMRQTTTSRCTVREESRLFVGMPHMHLLGTAFHQSIERAESSTREGIIDLAGWSFETQLFYDLETALHPGDVITTRCTFENTTSDTVTSGEDTNDEMCFDFAYVTPPPTDRYCDEGDDDNPTDVAYLPSACLPTGTAHDVPLVRGAWVEAPAPPALPAIGAVPDGRYVLESSVGYVSGVTTPIGNIDTEATYTLARGQLVVREGVLTYDVWQDSVVKSESGIRFGGPAHYDFAMQFDASASPLRAPLTCPPDGNFTLVCGASRATRSPSSSRPTTCRARRCGRASCSVARRDGAQDSGTDGAVSGRHAAGLRSNPWSGSEEESSTIERRGVRGRPSPRASAERRGKH